MWSLGVVYRASNWKRTFCPVKVAVLDDASGPWEPGEPAVIPSFPTPVVVGTAPSTCPLKNVTNTPESSGELHGTITATRTACAAHVPAGRNGTVRRAGANPRRSREFNVKRNVNLCHNLRSAMKPLSLLKKKKNRQPAQTRNFLVSYTSATSSLCYTVTRTCFSAHTAVLSTLVDH